MTDYSKGKIYSIRSSQTDRVYYGSTTQSLTKRMSVHKSKYLEYLDGKYHYLTSFDIVQHDDHYIELVEYYPCKTKEELLRREGEITRANKENAVNKCIAGRTRNEYYQNNKDMLKVKQKDYYNKNKTKCNEFNKVYYECNKEALQEHANEQFTCDCGGRYTRRNKSSHLKSQKHQQWLNQIN